MDIPLTFSFSIPRSESDSQNVSGNERQTAPGHYRRRRYLQLHHVPCVIYERESLPSAPSQGGSLDLHDDTGLKALRETGLIEDTKGMM